MVSLLRTIYSVKKHILPHATNFMNLCWQSFEIPSPYGSYSIGGYSGRAWTAQGGVTAPGRCVPFLLFLFQEVIFKDILFRYIFLIQTNFICLFIY